ncbi:hypothetical protein HanIR_Chr12g0567541 [Helianthus annuus]|nr:hypothetical protein HanIR_Chr12g0567541 [Helianthus annuus]
MEIYKSGDILLLSAQSVPKERVGVSSEHILHQFLYQPVKSIIFGMNI